MTLQYQAKAEPRFVTGTIDGFETIVVRPHRPFFVVGFLTCWFCAWTVAGIAAAGSLAAHFQPFVLFWLGAWACGWLYVLAILGWLYSGSETIAAVRGDVILTYSVFGFDRRRVYCGSDIRDLMAVGADTGMFGWQHTQRSLPFVTALKSGGLSFSHGARTIYAGVDLDKAEGRLIVARLAEHLPPTAIQGS